MVTLSGPGGVGKTRLALRVAEDLVGDFPDGVWFVPFSAIDEPALVATAVARVIGLREADGPPIEERLRRELAERRALLLLDGFEPVVAAAPFVADLLASAPGLAALVTSRARLRVRGEHDWPVPPLPVPARPAVGQAAPTVEAIGRGEAVRLFVARAREAAADFALSEANAAAVAEVCRRLDGLPLAIELAAARTRVLTPAALLARLDRRLALLSDGPRDVPDRSRTLRGAIAWSYDALDPSAQALFRHLAPFVDGFSLVATEWMRGTGADAAGASVATGAAERTVGERGAPFAVLDALTMMGDVSLLRPVGDGDDAEGPRFALLETVREFGRERLAAAGEDGAAANRHAAWFLALAETGAAGLVGPDQGTWLDRLERDHGNLRAAFAWLGERQDAAGSLRLAAALWRFWLMRGHLTEGRRRLAEALRLPVAGEAAG